MPEENNKFCLHTCYLLDLPVNKCKCANGVAHTGANCPINGASKCKSCNPGWTISHTGTACISTCTEFYSRCVKKLNVCIVILCVCCRVAENTCTCANGVARSGAGCTKNGDAKCAFCKTGWTLDHSGTQCISTCEHYDVHGHNVTALIVCFIVLFDFAVNACTCKNGFGQFGPGCPSNGAAKCASCNPGWTVSHDQTCCNCKYLFSYMRA